MEPYAFNPDLAHAATLPASWYWDATVLDLEARAVFGRAWQWVGLATQVANAGGHLTASVGREEVLVCRGEGGVLRAFPMSAAIGRGPWLGCGQRKKFQCPYHGWLYDQDGRLLKTPEFEGVEHLQMDSTRLPAFRAEVWGPFVFVCLDAAAPFLSEWLGAIPQEVARLPLDRMQHVRTHDYSLACNWKVYVDNFAYSDEVQREDILLCETVQKGLRSDHYHQGRYGVAREDGLHHFHGLMAEFLKD